VFKVGAWSFPFGVLLPLAAVGLALSWRKVPPSLLLILLVYSFTLVLVFVSARYRMPLVPLLAILAAEGAVETVRRASASSWYSLKMVALVIPAGLLVSTMPGPFPQETVDLEPEIYFGVGYNHYREQQWEEAVVHLSRAIELDPTIRGPRKFLGIALAELDRLDESETQFIEASRLNPNDREIQNNLNAVKHRRADYHFRAGRGLEGEYPDEAIEHFKLALASAPDWPEALARLAWMRATTEVDSLRDGAEALRLIRTAREVLGRDDPYLLLVNATAHAETGEWTDAITLAEQALASAVETPDADLVRDIRAALAEFRLGRPWRQ
jgi:tetratricopeptide (TPR) repeat protein